MARVVAALPAANATADTRQLTPVLVSRLHRGYRRGRLCATASVRPREWHTAPPGSWIFTVHPRLLPKRAPSRMKRNLTQTCLNLITLSFPRSPQNFAMVSDIGDPIEEEIAQSTSYLMTHQLQGKVLDEVKKSAKYPAPSNCQNIEAPKVNPVIWDNLPPMTKSCDLK